MTRILVVDDETTLVELVQSYLEREQYEVLTAADGRAALDLARTSQPDLVVLDVMLPILDGIEVCRQLRQFSDAYVIMLTARAEEIDKILGLTVGADDYLTKPFSPRELVARIKALLRRPRQTATALHPGSEPLDDTPAPQHWDDLTIDEAQHEVTLHGQPVELTAREFSLLLAHTFTIAQLNLNVPLPGDGMKGKDYNTVTFSFRTGAAGTYTFRCFDPCGTGPMGMMGPMMTQGYMIGTLTVQ